MSIPQSIRASFLVSGIMCHQGCGASIRGILNKRLEAYKKEMSLPPDAELIMDAEPQAFGIHRLFLTIESRHQPFNQQDTISQSIIIDLKQCLADCGFDMVDNLENIPQNENNWVNWIHILINCLSMGSIIFLSWIFPPSMMLTGVMFILSFLTTGFTARAYLNDFLQNIRYKNWSNMSTTITFGWVLSLLHTIYHTMAMPLTNTFPMIFMCFIMPVLLITIINGMDEIKRLVLNTSKKMHLQGMKTLFPKMAEQYKCYELSKEAHALLCRVRHDVLNAVDKKITEEVLLSLQERLKGGHWVMKRKSSLKKDMVLNVNRGECFPVDCYLIQGSTVVDASILNGEPKQVKQCSDFVPAGAINLGKSVTVLAIEEGYNGTLNKLLFCSNRAKKNSAVEVTPLFNYLYAALIALGIVAAIITPYIFGILTTPLLLQNITGILFAVCPCTMAIAHQLPKLLSMHRRSYKGIMLRDDHLIQQTHEIHTVVFDKTGTLTTGKSLVESYEGISPSLWERIYLLETHLGADHPLAKAIIDYYEVNMTHQSIIADINAASVDSKNQGLSAVVQGRSIVIGNAAYLKRAQISIPALDDTKKAQGMTPIYVAESGEYKGVIWIQHEIRENILASLVRLKKEGKKLIMLTGDSQLSALGFNNKYGNIFSSEHIHAEQTPDNKESFLSDLMSGDDRKPEGVWFVGDGLNDAPCARTVTEKGGVSCALTADDKSAFFTDISLNGSLDYLFEHQKLNEFFKKNIIQNKGLLIYGAIALLAFIIVFSFAGIELSPLIPLMIMVSTTGLILFNAYRIPRLVDEVFDKHTPWLKRLLASDVSIGLLTGASFLLNCGLLISTAATGGLAFPTLVFTAGAVPAISSACVLGAGIFVGVFVGLLAADLFIDPDLNTVEAAPIDSVSPLSSLQHQRAELSSGFQLTKVCHGIPLSVAPEIESRRSSYGFNEKW